MNYGWQDGIDQPLVEESEQYTVRVLVAGEIQGDWITVAPFLALSPIEAAVIPLARDDWTIEVRQIGRFGVSAPHVITAFSL